MDKNIANTNNKQRMIQINTYYDKMYRAQTDLIKLIMYIGVVLLILVILRKNMFIPESVSNILVIFVLAIGLFKIIRQVIDIASRNNMDFDSYDRNFNPDAQKAGNYDNNYEKTGTDLVPGAFNGLDCIGAACCTEGMKYDIATRICIKKVAPETFVSGQLTQNCFKKQTTNGSKNNPIIPYGSYETINYASL